MPKAKKLPSGNWRCQAYSHTDRDGKRHYVSFTAPTKKEAEYKAAEFALDRKTASNTRDWTVGDAVDHYIELRRPVLSPTTIRSYESYRTHAFPALMDVPLIRVDSLTLQTAINDEVVREPGRGSRGTVSPKSIKNSYCLISAALKTYLPDKTFRVSLPKSPRRIKRALPSPEAIYQAVKDTDIELPVLLAMWLSFTMSEIRGLTKSKSIDGEYITIREVLVVGKDGDIRKEMAKEETRNRRHRMPGRIKELVEAVEGDVLVPMTPSVLLKEFKRRMEAADIPVITFHDLRHINASVMAMLRIPDVYAQERGGWKTDHVMKSVYTEVFSAERIRVDDLIDGYFEKFV